MLPWPAVVQALDPRFRPASFGLELARTDTVIAEPSGRVSPHQSPRYARPLCTRPKMLAENAVCVLLKSLRHLRGARCIYNTCQVRMPGGSGGRSNDTRLNFVILPPPWPNPSLSAQKVYADDHLN